MGRRATAVLLLCSTLGDALRALPSSAAAPARALPRLHSCADAQRRTAPLCWRAPQPRLLFWPVGDPEANPREVKSPSNAPFSGLRDDIALRLPMYADDWREGVRSKTVGATLFLYFACLAPVVAFGGAMQIATGGQLGIVETIISRGALGMAYSCLAGQPMTFIGPTGLTLAFTTALYAFTAPRGIPFLPMYSWVGMWTAAFLVTAAVTNLAGFIRYCTRFTEDVFNAFLGTTYLWTAACALFGGLTAAVRAAAAGVAGAAAGSASALLSVVLGLGTFQLCDSSDGLASSRYFPPMLRNFIADFGPALAVGLISALSFAPATRLLAEVPRLALPAGAVGLGRPLLIPFLTLPTRYRLLATVPAFFLALLFFLDQNITVRTVNSPINKLRPRATYHLDLLVLGLLTGAASVCGLPWMCAATVESINHIKAMTTYEEGAAPSSASSQAVADAEASRSEYERAYLAEEFAAADLDGSGSLTVDEIIAFIQRSIRKPDGRQISSEQAAEGASEALRRFDLSGTGRLEFAEFAAWASPSTASATAGEAAASDAPPAPVIETRLSGFCVHAMVLATLKAVGVLRVVPIAVVNGVFIYLGKKVMSGNQFLQRLRALAVPLPTKLRTDEPSERAILVLGRGVAARFTGLQLACLSTLWALKLTPGLGMVFPAAIGVLMFIRAQLLPRLFTRRQLSQVDTPVWSIRVAVARTAAARQAGQGGGEGAGSGTS